MTFLEDLASYVETAEPAWQVELSEEGRHLVLGEPEDAGHPERLQFVLGEDDGVVFFEGLWRLPLPAGAADSVRDLLLGVVRDGIEHRGWEVPILLQGGPLDGQRVTKHWEDLVGRLVFARSREEDGRGPEAHLYKWHLRQSDEGDYVCRYERTLAGEDMDAFLARGTASTGPFVVIHHQEPEG